MPHQSSSQPTTSKSLAGRSRGESSRSAGRSNDLFRGISPSNGSPATASSQPASSSRLERALVAERRERQAAENDDAARKAARQKRRQYEPYQVRGWESLYGGGGSGSRNSHRSSSSSKQQKETSSSGGGSSSKNGAMSSSQSLSRSNQAPVSASSGRSQSPSKKPSSSRTSMAQLPSSTAPPLSRDRRPEASPTGSAKRKARSPASQPSPTKKARASNPSGRKAAAEIVASDDSDSDFEVVSINGEPPLPLPSNPSRTTTVKASPSPVRALKSSQPTRRGVLRRSESRAASSGRPSQAIPSSPSPAAQERPPCVPPSASQASLQSCGSRASSEASSSGTTIESREKELERQDIILAALKRGSSFADQISAVTRDFIATPSSSQTDLKPVEVFQRKVDNLGNRLKSRDVTLAKKEVPVALQRRLGSVLAAWHKFRKETHIDGQDDVERNISTTSAPASSVSQSTATTVPTANATSTGVTEQAEAMQRRAESEEVETSADSLQGPDRNDNAGAQPSNNVSAHHLEVAPADTDGDDADEAVAGLDLTGESAESPQAYGTPPEQPLDDVGNDESDAAAVFPSPRPEEHERHAPSEGQLEPAASSQIAEEEEDEVAEEEETDDEVGEQHQTQPKRLEEQDESEEEDELVDELMDDEPTDASGGSGAALAPEGMHEDLQIATGDDNATNASSSTQAREHVANPDPSSGPTDVVRATETLQDPGSQADPGPSVTSNAPENGGDASTEAAAEANAVADDDQTAETADAAHSSAQPVQEERPVPTESGEQVSAMNQEDEQQTESTNEQVPEPAPIPAVEQQEEHRDRVHDDQTDEQRDPDFAQASADELVDQVIDDTPALGSMLAAGGDVPENVTGGLNTPIDPMTDQVAPAVEAVENALAVEGELNPDNPEDASIDAQDVLMEADDQVHTASGAEDTTDRTVAGDADAANAQSDAVMVATPCVPSPARTADADTPAPAVEEPTSIEIPDASGDDNAPSASSAQRSPHPSVAIPTSEASAELQEAPLTAAAAAVSALNDANSNENILSNLFAQASNEASVAQQGETAVSSVGATEPTTAPTPATAETHLEATADEAARNYAGESSQAASDSHATSRPKSKVDDRMRSMLRDLADFRGRRSSYRTIRTLKPLRAGFSTPETVSDLVNNWQEPSKMIPWTCLQELSPAIFHRNAHRHMHLSMHELMDKVSSTRSVTHLSERLPERVITRALMEFPRIPHMLHCWNEETIKYYISRELPQPTDTQPEFRFADADDGNVVGLSRASAPPSSTASPMLEERKPRPGGSASGSRMSTPSTPAPLMTQSQHVPTPTPGHASTVMNNATLGPAAPPNQTLQAQSPTLMQAGNQLLVEHLARNQQRAPPSTGVQQLRQHILGNQDIRSDYRAQIAAAAGRGPPILQQPTIREAFQQQAAQTVQPASVAPSRAEFELNPADIERYRERYRERLVQQRAQQVQQLLAAHQQAAQQQAQQQQARQQAQQVQQQAVHQQLSATRQAAMVKQATDSVFTELAADCLSFAEHVIGSRGTSEVNLQRHFSEADVLHVIDFVVATYRREVGGQDAGRAQERLGKISAVRGVAIEVMRLTQTLCHVKMCLNEVAMESLRSTGRAETRGWLERLRTGVRWEAVRRVLLQEEAGRVGVLSAGEVELLLGRQIEVVNRRLEGALERLMGVDELVGAVCEDGEREAWEGMRKECEQIGLICCKHVVGVLVGEPEAAPRG